MSLLRTAKTRLLTALLAGAFLLALNEAPAVAQFAYPAVYPETAPSWYQRGPMGGIPDNTAGFLYAHFTQWPGAEPPVLTGYTNLWGAPLQMQTLYTTDTRTFSVGEVLAFHTTSPTCGCETVPAYYVFVQMSPAGQGFIPDQFVHDQFLTAYFCCSFGDGNAQTLLAQWDSRTGSVALSINASPWLAPIAYLGQGFPFNVALGSQNQLNLIDTPYVGYWPNFPQTSTQWYGAINLTQITIWGNGFQPYTAVNLNGATETYPVNYGAGGSYVGYGDIADYLIFP